MEKSEKEVTTREKLGLSRLPKDIYQSFAFTVSRYRWSVYEKRIVYRLIEMAQCELQGVKFSDGLHNIEPNKLAELHEITMPVQDILANEKDTHFDKAKAAFKSLAKKGCEYEDDEEWAFVNIIAKPKIKKGSGLIHFVVFDEFWRLLLRFGSDPKGYRKYELLTAMSFDSIYSMRLYELVSGQKNQLEFSLETLADMLQLTKRMSRPDALEARVLNVAQAELDEKAPYSFTYKRKTVPSRGRNKEKVVGYYIQPRFIHQNRNNALEMKDISAKLPAGGRFGGLLSPDLYKYLTTNLGWSKASVNANKQLLVKAQKTLPDLLSDLSYFNSKGRNAGNQVGYVINALKNKIEQYEKDNERKRQESHEAAPAAPVAPSAPTQPATPPTGSEAGKRRLQNAASMLANKYNVREPDLFSQKR